ncbi:MAG TPA: DUF1464 family protein [Gemmatimonadales bacterium]|nr:DUF1464 family protein [Gemmatimonadales bacterium]
MPRVIGIDPGTVSLDLCGLADGRVDLDLSFPTEEALADPERFIAMLTAAGPPDLIAGPSGYGLPLARASDLSDEDLCLAFLARRGEGGGIGGLRRFARLLGGSGLPVVFTPGVIHLDTVPAHRKINRIDLGTADKLAVAALAIEQQHQRTGRPLDEISLIVLELGGAFTAALAVHRGQVVDGLGGTSGPIGWRAAGALDGEVVYLAGGPVDKAFLFQGGVETVALSGPGGRLNAVEAYLEGAAKAVHLLRCSAPAADEVLVSGRAAADADLVDRLAGMLTGVATVRPLPGFAVVAKQGAQGAALIADGLAGGRCAPLVRHLRIREAGGSVLDHLHVIAPEAARRRLLG